MGYNPYFSGLDWNIDCPNRTGHLLRWRLNQIIRETGYPLIVFGHSLGGMLARFLGTNFPDQVRHVVTMGSPIQRTDNVSPLVLVCLTCATALSALARRAAGRVRDAPLQLPL